jgi:uroporphyrin-3 C-methyltransferase
MIDNTDLSSINPIPTPEPKPVPPPKTKKSHKCVITLIILLCILIAGGVGLAWCWHNYEVQKQAALKKQINALQLAWTKTQAQVEHQAHMTDMLEQSLKQYHQGTWPLAQAQYLVKLAAFNLAFENNAQLAIQILKAADSQLQATNDPSLLPVRSALANDIAHLSATAQVDVSGVIARLNAISGQIKDLPQRRLIVAGTASVPAISLASDISAAQTPQTLPKTHYLTTAITWIKHFAEDIWEILKTLIVIHHNVPDAAPLLPPEQYAYTVINIQAQLTLAQWAIIHQKPEVYAQSLKQAIDWIGRYFLASDPTVISVLQQLEELSKIDVKPALPDVSHSLDAIQQAMDK